MWDSRYCAEQLGLGPDDPTLRQLAAQFPSLYCLAMQSRYVHLAQVWCIQEGRRASRAAGWTVLTVTLGVLFGALPSGRWLVRPLDCFKGSRLVLARAWPHSIESLLKLTAAHWRLFGASAAVHVLLPGEAADHAAGSHSASPRQLITSPRQLITPSTRVWAAMSSAIGCVNDQLRFRWLYLAPAVVLVDGTDTAVRLGTLQQVIHTDILMVCGDRCGRRCSSSCSCGRLDLAMPYGEQPLKLTDRFTSCSR